MAFLLASLGEGGYHGGNIIVRRLPRVFPSVDRAPSISLLVVQAPTRTLDGRDPFRSDADGATNYLPRHRNPPEDVSQVTRRHGLETATGAA